MWVFWIAVELAWQICIHINRSDLYEYAGLAPSLPNCKLMHLFSTCCQCSREGAAGAAPWGDELGAEAGPSAPEQDQGSDRHSLSRGPRMGDRWARSQPGGSGENKRRRDQRQGCLRSRSGISPRKAAGGSGQQRQVQVQVPLTHVRAKEISPAHIKIVDWGKQTCLISLTRTPTHTPSARCSRAPFRLRPGHLVGFHHPGLARDLCPAQGSHRHRLVANSRSSPLLLLTDKKNTGLQHDVSN